MSTDIQTAVDSSLDKGGRRRRGGEMLQQKQRQPLHIQHKKHKPEEMNRGYRCCRKRSHSFAGGNTKFFQPHKKRKQVIPPTKFLLGGNINDPLNLNSLQDEEVNRVMNAVTPESSPLPTPQHRKGEIEVIIPPNINDPLNLAGCEEDNESYEALLSTPIRKVRKKHKKKRQRSCTGNENSEVKSDESKTEEVLETDLRAVEDVSSIPAEIPILKTEPETAGATAGSDVKKEVTKPTQLDICGGKEFKKPKREDKDSGSGSSGRCGGGRKFDSKDKIVSPVIPQPGGWNAGHRFRKSVKKTIRPLPKFREQDKRFQYGNYNRYYGYRNPNHEVDPRLKLLAARRELFEGKDVLDIGCNTGHVTLSVARDLGAKSVVGLDVDRSLVEIARNNVRHYVSNKKGKTFPISMQIIYGSLDLPGRPASGSFPHNVSFVQGNYVLQSDVLLDLEQPQFDVILCLSVTKWFHLNWGDRGLKSAFKRMFAQLRPGGTLVLEAQSWASYKKKKTLTETIWKNYNDIKLYPTMFTQFLLTEVGFSKCEVMGSPMHHSKGFQRPIRVFTKGETPVESRTPAQGLEEEVKELPKAEMRDMEKEEVLLEKKSTQEKEQKESEAERSDKCMQEREAVNKDQKAGAIGISMPVENDPEIKSEGLDEKSAQERGFAKEEQKVSETEAMEISEPVENKPEIKSERFEDKSMQERGLVNEEEKLSEIEAVEISLPVENKPENERRENNSESARETDVSRVKKEEHR